MATVNTASLRNEFEACKADIDSLRKEGEITEKADKAITDLCDMTAVMIAAFLPPFHSEVRHLMSDINRLNSRDITLRPRNDGSSNAEK